MDKPKCSLDCMLYTDSVNANKEHSLKGILSPEKDSNCSTDIAYLKGKLYKVTHISDKGRFPIFTLESDSKEIIYYKYNPDICSWFPFLVQ